MNVTQLLITGFDDNDPVFAVHLSADAATTVLISAGDDGLDTVDAVAERRTPVFTSVRELLEELTVVPA